MGEWVDGRMDHSTNTHVANRAGEKTAAVSSPKMRRKPAIRKQHEKNNYKRMHNVITIMLMSLEASLIDILKCDHPKVIPALCTVMQTGVSLFLTRNEIGLDDFFLSASEIFKLSNKSAVYRQTTVNSRIRCTTREDKT